MRFECFQLMAGDWEGFFYLVFFDMEDTERSAGLKRTWMLW